MGSDMIDLVNVKKSKSGGKCFPPGFRFHPTDEELVLYYLKRKICRRSLKMDIIGEVDVYKWDPEELPGQSKLKSGDRQWFFFSPRDRRYPNGARSSRATMNGYWKATGKDRTIKRKSSSVGNKKTLVYYQGRAPSGLRTDWVMHEYTMDEEELRRCPYAQDHYVLYKVFKKSGPGPKNGEQYGAPFVEEEWSDDDCLDVEILLVQNHQPIPINDFKSAREEEAPLSNDDIEFLHRIIEPEVLPPLPQITEKAKMGVEPEPQPLVVEEDFLEMNDLLGPEPEKCSFDSLSEFDFYQEADAFGSQPFELQPAYMDNLEFGPANSGLVSEVVNHDNDELQMSYDLWNHDQGESSSITTSYQNVSQASSGVVIEENPGKLEYNVNQCPQTNMDDGTNSWLSSALWSFVDSIPTTPASAAESSALVNRAFERMSSFSKGRNINLAAAVAAVEKRLEKPKPSRSRSSSKGIVYFSIVGVLFAILVVFSGSSIELLGRYIRW
ncbi:hypothetical protein CTI12_AA107230 [Artemisia annua]|uniref:NAC domain-containing protein n=1 Tax=Artemisia annua TaxID=35608 RepID=A0A2U1PVR6_ARTAN|nr:hypothetical protein CTI12_AA107230 [Artemisia annua]